MTGKGKFTVDYPEHFGQRLKMARMARCLPQRAFSASVGMAQTSLSNVEIGRFVPADPAVREAIAREMGVRWDWLMNGSGLPFQLEEGIEILNLCRKQDQQQAAFSMVASLDCHGVPVLIDWPARFLALQFRPKLFYIILMGATAPLGGLAGAVYISLEKTILKTFKSPKFIILPFRQSILDVAKRMRINFTVGDAFTLNYLVNYTGELMKNKVSKDSARALKREVDLHINNPEFFRELRALTEKFKNR